ncbi:MAG: Holliday junction resolvase RuvX [Fimbriimonadales bacterium]|nr:Holliday junction resolvase RuvX [Fimbriimonadales bacterium]
MRVLGVDFGSKRIGLAVGESAFGVVSPKGSLAASGSLEKDARAIDLEARRQAAEEIAVGLPLDAQGGDTPMAVVCRRLAERLTELGWRVRLVDERLTSVEAESAMARAGLKASQAKRRKDAEAAARILDRLFAEGGHGEA